MQIRVFGVNLTERAQFCLTFGMYTPSDLFYNKSDGNLSIELTIQDHTNLFTPCTQLKAKV